VSENTRAAQLYLSLGSLYYSRGKIDDSIRLLEKAKSKSDSQPKISFLLGKIYYERGEREKALEEFSNAKALDPFYEDIHKHLGILFSESHELEAALNSFFDAYILSGGSDPARTGYYQRQIQRLLKELGREEKSQYDYLFEQRKQNIMALADSLLSSAPAGGVDETADRVEILRGFSLMKNLRAEDVRLLANITQDRNVVTGEIVFREEDLTEAIYFIQSGSVRIVKSTPFGEQLLSTLTAGEYFGEMDFIDSLHCSADAIANEESMLLCVSKTALDDLLRSRKDLAVQFYWHFWRTLSRRIRESNELLKSFFGEDEKSGLLMRNDAERTDGESVTVDAQEKKAVLYEKGLSSNELALLASYGSEEFFRAGQNIFVEGEAGDKLYIVLEGQVRISKFIPGIGEEALAILGKGDFFGEMALIDQEPRSADAKAHTDATVLPIKSGLLTDVLARDMESSFQFLNILCKMLSRRLREINLKIYQWRIMSGRF
jgi:CRP-like cAMP-binding protein